MDGAMSAGMMTRDEEIRALAELLDLYRHWIRGAVAVSRLDEAPLGDGFEAVVVETEALDVWMAALDRTADRLMLLTGKANSARDRVDAAPAQDRPAARAAAGGRPALRLVT
jgi:hypothetical protein